MLSTSIRRPLAAFLAVVVMAMGLAVTVAPGRADAHDVLFTEAWDGARWLASQMTEDGYIPDFEGQPAPSNTVQSALALAAARIQEPSFDAAVGWVSDHVGETVSPGGIDDPGAIAYVILLAVAAGEDPTTFGGVDLPVRLLETLGDDGMFGGAVEGYDPTYSGVYNQGLALTALAGAGVEVPEQAIEWLLAQQCTPASSSPPETLGGWQSYRADPSQPCVTMNPENFTGTDSNSSAMAAQGLLAIEVDPDEDPLVFFAGIQNDDGGFPFFKGDPSDPNSTALVIQAILAFDLDPTEAPWLTDEGDPFTSLFSWQIPWTCELEGTGAFSGPFSGGFPDQIATQQAVWAAGGAVFPIEPDSFFDMELAPAFVFAQGEPGQATVDWFPPFDSPVSVVAYEVRDAGGDLLVVTSGLVCQISIIGLPADSEQSFTVTAIFADGSATTSEISNEVFIDPPEETFTDVAPGQPFYAEINWAVFEGITRGFDDDTFRPAQSVTRQAMAAFLYRFAGEPEFDAPAEPTFPDVPLDHPFYEEIEWLWAEGIATGYEDGDFQPTNAVTRQAMAAFLFRFAEPYSFVPDVPPIFPDVPPGSAFYDEIQWLGFSGIAAGYDGGDFQPSTAVARQAMVAFMYRYTLEYPLDICTCPL